MNWDFDRETAVQLLDQRPDASRYTGILASTWNIGSNPNGGYLLGVLLAAIRRTIPHQDPLSVTTHYLRPGLGGEPFEAEVEILRGGRSLTTVRARLLQANSVRIEVLAAFGSVTSDLGFDLPAVSPAPRIPAPDACPARDGAAQGVDLAIQQRLEVRFAPAESVATTPADTADPQRARMDGWIRLADGRAPDTLTLPVFADGFPPSPFALLGRVGWVPTVELTVHVVRAPAPGWVQARFETDSLHLGRMIETGWLWDSTGALVAESRQLGLVRRNP